MILGIALCLIRMGNVLASGSGNNSAFIGMFALVPSSERLKGIRLLSIVYRLGPVVKLSFRETKALRRL